MNFKDIYYKIKYINMNLEELIICYLILEIKQLIIHFMIKQSKLFVEMY